MTRRRFLRTRCVATLLLAVTLLPSRDAWAVQSSRELVLQSVNNALATAERGNFAAARSSLERSLAQCGTAVQNRECRVLYASGLGSLLQRQASVELESRDTLYMQAIGYYDRILQEVPNDP
jgi:hypothetical protein